MSGPSGYPRVEELLQDVDFRAGIDLGPQQLPAGPARDDVLSLLGFFEREKKGESGRFVNHDDFPSRSREGRDLLGAPLEAGAVRGEPA